LVFFVVMPVLQTNDQSLEGMDFKIAQNGVLDIDRKKGIVEAFAAVIGNKDNVNDIIMPGAFQKSLKNRQPRAVWHHSWQHPIGKVLAIEEVDSSDFRATKKMREANAGGLWVKVQFNLNTQRGRDAFADVEFFGKDFGWSIGYKTRRANPLAETLAIKAEEIGQCDVKACAPAGEKEEEPEEKIGRTVAARNMKRLQQAIEILQQIVAEGGVEEEVMEKTRLVADYEKKSAEDLSDNEALVYGNTDTVKGITLDLDVGSRGDVAEVLIKTNELICSGGFLAQVPHSKEGGVMKFYFPGDSSIKSGMTILSALLEKVSFPLNPRFERIGAYGPSDTISVGELFQEPSVTNQEPPATNTNLN